MYRYINYTLTHLSSCQLGSIILHDNLDYCKQYNIHIAIIRLFTYFIIITFLLGL